jgi:CubicO group peptidase (beta-lactamase class C family)
MTTVSAGKAIQPFRWSARAALALSLTTSGAAFAATGPQAPACRVALEGIEASVQQTLGQGAPGMMVAAAVDGGPMLAMPRGRANLEHDVPLARGSVFPLASVTKQFTAALILSLREEGRLKLEDPLSRYIPELPQAGRVTLYQLLVQTSGLPDYSEDPAGSASKSVARTPAEMVAWIARLQPAFQFEPGTRWAYSNSNYVLLGLVAERAGGKPLAALFEERLFRPAGLKVTAIDDPTHVVTRRVQGYRRDRKAAAGFTNAAWISPTIPGPAGGLRSTADDLIRWTDALFGGRVLKPESLKLMLAPGRLNDGRTTRLGMPADWQRGMNADYAMGLFVTPGASGPRYCTLATSMASPRGSLTTHSPK